MGRVFAIALMLGLAAPAWAQNQSPPSTGATRPAAQKPAARAKTTTARTAKPSAAPQSGPCQIGVIPAIGDRLSIQHVGLTVFGNELNDIPIEPWGLGDLVVARVRAAAGALTIVRRIAFSREAFEAYYHPPRQLFGRAGGDLTTIVRQIAGNANCERYLVVTESRGQYGGTNQTMEGIGVVTNWSSGMSKTGALFAYIQLTVFDGRSFAMREDPLGTFGARLAASLSKDDSIQSLDNFEPPASPDAAVDNARLRDGVRALLAAKLDRILPAYLNDGGRAQ